MKNWKLFCISFFLSSFLIANFASAWVIGESLVPCGGPSQPACSQCELLHLVDNLMDFILIAAAPILATFFFILAGLYIMLGGAKPDMLATGKRMFTSALIGIIIVMLAWLITNTLITTLIAPAPFGSNISFNSSEWWSLACGTINLDTSPPGTSGGGGGGGTTIVISGERAINITSTSVTITWNTNVPATSHVQYNSTSNFGTGSVQSTQIDSNLVTSHSVTITGLNSNFLYYYRVVSGLAVGSVQQFQTTSGSCADPCISNEQVVNITNNSVTITWRTSTPAPSQVKYGPGPSVPLSTTPDNTLVTSHSVTIPGLNSSFQYWYQVISSPSVGSVQGPFTTLP